MIPPIYKRNLKIWAMVIALLLCYAHFLYAAEKTIESDQAKLILDSNEGWNIPDGDTLKVIYTGSASDPSALLRDSSGNSSYWGGTFWSNYSVLFVNPNGITFGANANIQAASFIASTLNISNSDFLNGKFNFYKVAGKDGFIFNRGSIIVRNGGYVALLSQAVENQGKILTNLGTVVLASGEKMTLALDDINEISVVIDEAVKDIVLGENGERIVSAVKNSGTISANGGKVVLTAKVLNNVFDYAINNTGIIEAKSVVNHNGVIELVASGAPIVNTGTLEAGAIKVNANGVEFINKGKLIAGSEPNLPDSGKVAVWVGSLVQGGLISADKIVTVEAERVEVVLDGPLALEIDPLLNTSPGVIIQAPQVKIIAKQFGSSAAPLNIDAALTYIYRTQGDINILESLGIGTSVLLRGPPGDFGAIVYHRDTNLTLKADHVNLIGSAPTYLYGNITFSNFTCTVPAKEIYFEAGKAYTILGEFKIQGAYAQHIKLLSSEKGKQWFIDPQGTRDLTYTWVEDSYNLNSAEIMMSYSTNRDGSFGWDPDITWKGGVGDWNVGANWVGEAVPGAGDNAIINAGTCTVTAAATITNLTIGTGATLIVTGVNFTVNGTTSVSGTLNITGTNGTKTFVGLVTINPGGTWNETVAEAITFRGGITNNGTFTADTGVHTFDTNSQSLNGTLTIPKVTVTGVTLTNNDTLTISTALEAGTDGGTLTNATGATLNIGDGAIDSALTLNASADNNTVNYNDAGAQDIKATTYHHLIISGSGTKDLVGNTTVNGDFTVSGVTLNPTANFKIIGSGTNTLNVDATGIIQVDAATFAGNYESFEGIELDTGSTVDYSGSIDQTVESRTYSNLTISGSGSTKTLGGAITVNSSLTISAGATLDVSVNNYGITIGGSWTDTGTGQFTHGSGTVTFNGTGNINSNNAFYNIKIDTAGTVTLTGTTTTVNGDLTVTAGSTLSMNDTLSVTGLTDISGTLTITGTTGTKTFNNIRVNNGGTMNFGAAEAIAVNGNLQVDGTGTITGTTGLWTFQKAEGGGTISGSALSTTLTNVTFTTSYTNTGTYVISDTLTVSGTTFTNNGTLTVSTLAAPLAGGTLTNATGATLNIGDAGTIDANLTLNASADNNTVNYNLAGAQTVKATIYHHLTLSGSGTKTLTSLSTVNGNLTLSGTVTATTAAALAIGGNLVIGDGTTFTAAGFALTVTGTTTVGGGTSGNLTINNATGAKTFTGLVTVNANGTWNNPGNSAITFKGGVANSGTFTAGSGVYTFSTNDQAISGTLSIPSITVDTITLTNNNTLTITTALAGNGGLTNSATGTLNLNFGGAVGITTLTATAVGNAVNYGFAGDQTIKATTYDNLTISGSGTKTAGGALTINGDLAVAAGTLDPDGNTITGSGDNTLDVTGTIKADKTNILDTYISFETLTFNPGSTVNYSGTDQNIDDIIYQNLTISGSGTKTLVGAITVNGNLTVSSGILDPGVNVINGNATGTLTVGSSGTIRICTATSEQYSWEGPSVFEAGSTVEYKRDDVQTIDPDLPYQNLTLSGSGTKTLGNNTTVNGNLIVNTGTTLATATYTLGIGGDFTVNGALTGSGAVSLSGSSKNIDGSGTIANPVTITNAKAILSSANLTFNGVVTMSGGAADVTNNGTVTFTSTLDGSGGPTWTNAANSILNYAGATLFATSGILDADTSPNTVNYNSTGIDQTIKGETYYHLKITKGTRTATLGAATTVDGNLTITSGTLNTSTRNLTVNGNTSISGTLNFDAAGSTRLFVGLVTINGTWNNSANDGVTLRGGITNNATFTAGTGIYTFNTNNQSLNGTFDIPKITITGVTLTNNGTLTVSTALAGTGTLAQGTNATLNIGDSTIAPTLTATATGNTVNYNAAGAQTIKAANYYNLALSTSGTKTFASGTTGIANTLTITGTAIGNTTTNSATIDYNGTGAQTILVLTYNNLTLSGGGTKTLGGAITVSGNLTINSGVTLDVSGSNYSITLGGNWSNSGTFDARSGTVTFNKSSGTQTLNSGGTGADKAFYNLTHNGTGTLQLVTNDIMISNNFTTSGGFPVSGTFDANGRAMSVGGNWTTSYFTANGNTVTFNGSGTQDLASGGVHFYNFTVNKSAGTLVMRADILVDNNLEITNGTLDMSVSTFSITLGGNWINNGTFNAGPGTVYFTGTTTVSGSNTTTFNNITINNGATLTGHSTNMNVRGNWTNNGTFTHNSGAVAFIDNTQASTISGSTTFNNFKCETAGKTLNFASGSTQTIEGALTLTGASGNLITLARSGGAGLDQWNIKVTGTSSVSYVSVSNSNASGNTIVPTNSVDGGNNTNWSFISQIVFTTSAQNITAGAVSGVMTIQTQNASGDPTNVSSDTTIDLTSTSGNGKFYSDAAGTNQITFVTITNGTNSVSFYYKDTATGTPTLTASENPTQGWTDATQIETIKPATLDHFTLTGITSLTAGDLNSPVVTAYDQYNNVKTDYTGTVHFSSTDSQAVLPADYTFQAADNGAHTFTNGVQLKTANSQTVTVADSTKTGSQTVIIVPAAANKLAWDTQPTSPVDAGAIWTAFKIKITDQYGNTRTADTTAITIAPSTGTFASGSTTTQNAVSGVATFNDITYTVARTITVTGSATGLTATPASDNVTVNPAGPSTLVFIQQPTDATAVSAITPAVKVEIKDAYDNLRTADNTTTITISLGNNPGSGALSGTLTQTASAGVATFSGLAINKAGSGYNLKATSGTLDPVISASFNIAANPSDSQLSNAEVVRASIEIGLYQFAPFIPGGGAGYLYHPITPTDTSAFDQFMLQAGNYSFLDGVLNYTGNQELVPFFEELDKKGPH